ncbi:arsenate reductase ArsC [Calditrichota bacterium]
MRVLILCTGNSCRSQIAEGYIKHWYPEWEVYSAGTKPSFQVHPIAISVMREIGIDISNSSPKNIDKFLSQEFDYVITVCSIAKENCPIFSGKVNILEHIAFDDPAEATGTEEEIIDEFRRVRNDISAKLKSYFEKN